jgi:hypothetical protein
MCRMKLRPLHICLMGHVPCKFSDTAKTLEQSVAFEVCSKSRRLAIRAVQYCSQTMSPLRERGSFARHGQRLLLYVLDLSTVWR